jgi:hypothetical protein
MSDEQAETFSAVASPLAYERASFAKGSFGYLTTPDDTSSPEVGGIEPQHRHNRRNPGLSHFIGPPQQQIMWRNEMP